MLRIVILFVALTMGAWFLGLGQCEPSYVGASVLAFWGLCILVTIAFVARLLVVRRFA